MELNQKYSESGEEELFGQANARPSCLVTIVLAVALFIFANVAWAGSFRLCFYYAPSWVGSVAGFVLWILSLKIGVVGAMVALFFQLGFRAFGLVWRACRRRVGLDRHRPRDLELLEISNWGPAIGFVVAIFVLCALTALVFRLVGAAAPDVMFVEMAFVLGGYHALVSLIFVMGWSMLGFGEEY